MERINEYENIATRSNEWYTPKELFDNFNTKFDLDPCSPGVDHWVPAKKIFTKKDDGLSKKWEGFVFMNPPFGARNSHTPWLIKFLNHNNGIAIVRAYTSAAWFHNYAIQADAMLFPKGKTKFIRPDGSIGKSPGHGIVLLAMGAKAVKILKKTNLGFFINKNEY